MSATLDASVRAWRAKVVLVGSGLFALAIGVLLAVAVLAEADAALASLLPEWARAALEGFVGSRSQAGDVARGARILWAGFLCAALFILAIGLGWMAAAPAASSLALTRGETSGFGRFCRRASHGTAGAALLHLLAGFALALAGALSVPILLTSLVTLAAAPLVFGVALFFGALGIATLIPLPRVLEEPAAATAVTPTVPDPPRQATAEELLRLLRASSLYRRQVVVERHLSAVQRVAEASGEPLAALLRRWPRLDQVVRAAGLALTEGQGRAVDALLAADQHRDARDVILMGDVGSGRTTVACLVALGAILHREGALFCVTPSGPDDGVDADTRLRGRGAVRHPRVVLRRLLSAAGLDGHVCDRALYGAASSVELTGVDVLYADALMLSRGVLAHANGAAAAFLRRLRFVVVDHPERLPRHELLRLRVALARLRITAAALGANPTVVLILPPMQNQDAFAKYLLGEAHVETVSLLSWVGASTVVGWMAPMELVDSAAERPTFARGSYMGEVHSVLVEIGRCWSRLHAEDQRPPRLALVDPLPLLGPEARSRLRDQVVEAVASGAGVAPSLAWDFLSSAHVAVDRAAQWDVVILLGAGPIPEATLAPLRAALVDGGALILLATPSPDDLETLREMGDGTWPGSPSDALRGPSALLPTPGADLVLHELGRLFGDFGGHPIPADRLLAAFTREVAAPVLERWVREGRIALVQVFEPGPTVAEPRLVASYVRRDPALTGDAWPVPWSCSTAETLEVWDETAGGPAARTPRLADHVDAARVFIDLHPGVVLRYAPNSVRVRRREPLPAPRPGAVGRLLVASQTMKLDLEVDRRLARVETTLRADVVEPDALAAVPLEGLLPASGVSARPARAWRLTVAAPEADPSVTLAVGRWPVRLSEALRDVVSTTERLVEDDGFMRHSGLADAPPSRTVSTPALHLFLGGVDLPGDPARSAAGVRGLARLLAARLRREYLLFDDTLRVVAVSGAGARILIYPLWADDWGAADSLERDVFGDAGAVDDLLWWMARRLATCACADGCAACCGGLGTISLLAWGAGDRRTFTEADVVSRWAAFELVCGLLGRDPTSVTEELLREARTLADDDPTLAAPHRLERLRALMIGTEAGGYADGEWTRLLAPEMVLDPAWVGPATWGAAPDFPGSVWGYYYPTDNRVVVRPHPSDDWICEVILHEYTHNWQHQAGLFDRGRHVESPEAQRYFEGKLVIEGHATWADHQFLLSRRLSGTMQPDDGRPWNEYKVGYMLMDAIERRVGRRGLYAWLEGRLDDPGGPIECRTTDLAWPFTLTQALEAAGLMAQATTGRYSAFDVGEGEPPDERGADEEGPSDQGP
ncbi:MAG: hypothetical protein AMXMBFR64_33250 [Myxococcales bacterium]